MKKYLIICHLLLASKAFALDRLGPGQAISEPHPEPQIKVNLVNACNAGGFKRVDDTPNLIENGSFEDPALAQGSWDVFPQINGWATTAGPGIEIQNQVAGVPFDGAQYAELDSHGNSVMEQTVAVQANSYYCLKFVYSPRPGVPLQSQGIRVWINKKAVKLVKISGAGLAYTQWQNVYIAWRSPPSDGLASVRFEAVGVSDSLGGYVDAVEMYLLAR